MNEVLIETEIVIDRAAAGDVAVPSTIMGDLPEPVVVSDSILAVNFEAVLALQLPPLPEADLDIPSGMSTAADDSIVRRLSLTHEAMNEITESCDC